MERHTPTVSELVRRAVEVADPDDREEALARLEEDFEDDDEPITAVDNIEERLAIAAEGADYEAENPAVAVALSIVLYMASHGGHAEYDGDPGELMKLAARAQWHRDPPDAVVDWLADRGVRL